MHSQLEILLQLQDLKSQRRELAEDEGERAVEEQEFHIDVGRALAELDLKIAEVEEELSAPVRRRYLRIVAAGRDRAVAPVINATCYGCFVSIPTAVASAADPQAELRTCDHCGRFVYFVR